MDNLTRVNFHCHSVFSHDGELTPEDLAEKLAGAGVQVAALTDHDTVDGLARFQQALKRRGIGFISGVEITAQHDGREIHLLGYGFDPALVELQEALSALRQVQGVPVHSITSTLIRLGRPANHTGQPNEATTIQGGQIEIADAIALIHRAGGKAFLAHPLVFEPDMEALDRLVADLKQKGLDGLESFYTLFTKTQQDQLWHLARKHALLSSGGSDAHRMNSDFETILPNESWKQFRNAIINAPGFQAPVAVEAEPAPALYSSSPSKKIPRFKRRNFVIRIVFPTVLAIGLFIAALWGVFLPSFERSLLDRKREMIRELTNSAWSILASYEKDERAGKLTRSQAQEMAISSIEGLRYGPDAKDYFWLQDMRPFIVMHPYRPDLNGQDVSQFTDPTGARIFVEFADLVRRQNEGYISYVWQWKDDPQRLEPKESYVKGFAPWNWIIGTGLYIDDVTAEIARVEQNLVRASVGISIVMVLLLLFVIQQSLRIERERLEANASLRESTERYRSLVEATTEGTLLILDQRCRYANPTLLELLGYSLPQLELLDLADVLPEEGNASAWRALRELPSPIASTQGLEGYLRRADGAQVECILAINPITFDASEGVILLAKDVVPQPAPADNADTVAPAIAAAAWNSPMGIFRARAARRGVLVVYNLAVRQLLQDVTPPESRQASLADLFSNADEFDEFFELILKSGFTDQQFIHLNTINAGTITLSLSARLVRDEHGTPAYIDGALQDITSARKQEIERQALIGRLQTSLLFLQEPVRRLGRSLVTCELETSIQKAAASMTASSASAAIVETADRTAIGMITDHNLRERVLAEGLDPQTSVRVIMSAPLVTISEDGLIFEALMKMEEKGVQHLAVVDENDRVVNIIRYKEMIQFHRYGLLVLTHEIARAGTVEQVIHACNRSSLLVKALVDSGAQPQAITQIISATCDAAVTRFIELAIADLGPAPAPFTFISLGSHGRQELTLFSDQDNALIYHEPEGKSECEYQATASYYLNLGEKVVDWLNRAGYPFCQGKMMANNPRWCQSLTAWKNYFNDWIRKAEPQELLEFSVFFDFRPVYGASDLAQDLRLHIQAVLAEYPAFFNHLARNALTYTPPTRLFGRITLSGGSMEHEGQLNLKDAMIPVVSFARLYALRNDISLSNTVQRIGALVDKNVLPSSSRDEIIAAYDFLMRLRLQHQVEALTAGHPLDNLIQPGRLGHIEAALLQQVFAQISAVQKKISYDFLGGT